MVLLDEEELQGSKGFVLKPRQILPQVLYVFYGEKWSIPHIPTLNEPTLGMNRNVDKMDAE